MLKGKIQICFDMERQDGGDFYYVSAVRNLTLKFGEGKYYTGFLNKLEKVDKFMLFKKYIVEAVFPSIDNDIFEKCKDKIQNQEELPICFGQRSIGTAILMNWILE